MLENIRISLGGLWSHKLRSLLTMLGIIIGIAAIIAIVSIILGTNERIKQNLIGSGNNAVEVQLYRGGSPLDFSYDSISEQVPALGEDDVASIEELAGVERASLYHKRSYVYDAYYLNTSISGATVLGVGQDFLSVAGYQVSEGRGISALDMSQYRRVCVVDATIVDSVFSSRSPLGKVVDIAGEPFVVVGVARKSSGFEPTISSVSDYYLYKGDAAGTIFVPDSMWPTLYSYDEPSSVMVRATSPDDMTTAGKGAQELLNARLPWSTDPSSSSGSTLQYQANDLGEEAAQLQELASSTNAMLLGIASISLLVGGIGVMNIMLVSVTERTHEIGLKKALGARKRAILAQFLTEAALLSLMGGILGVVLGIVLSHVIAAIAYVPVIISVPAILVAVAFSMVVGIGFGLMPSIKAANLNPIDALRYE